ncbi:RluA family pseudouridine synthase [Neobacillus bataviensis]|uniref:RluA family pseudouridine synthase n=1 Tax=Neobacillus bataviensis TaxID=220685 RepID=UPI001CBA971B|nr:RluA family pseudouridine synthase [Neobacillus bataviensis]
MLNTIRQGDWLQIITPKEWEGKTTDEIFRHEWKAPKKVIHSFRMEEKVRLEGNRVDWNLPLTAGIKLQIQIFEEEDIQVTPHYYEIDVLFEDDHFLVINKPPFMNTHPNDTNTETNTLINAASFYLLSKGEMKNVRQIHRLDRDTSGAILFAKHVLAGVILDRMLEERQIKRTYLAMVHGLIQRKKGTINAPIGRDRHHATKRRVSPSGQAAITHYQVLKDVKVRNLSYVKCWLDTGRTHQIRVHLSHLGHPLVGDILYGGKPLVNRQALHAAKLEFVHPFTHEKISCHAPFIDTPVIFDDIDVYSI